MNDRDHFAAAALTGLLYPDVDDEFAMSFIVGRAYCWADAMLRERERTNHGAAPAARATADRYVRRAAAGGDSGRTDKAAPRPSDGTGNTPRTQCTPGECSVQSECTFPLHLTVAEREAVRYYIGTGGPDRVDATLRGLLVRLGGDE